jgi:hypothetical protein
VIQTVHRHKEHRCNRSLYLDLTRLKALMEEDSFRKLTIRIHAEPRIDADDPEEDLSYDRRLKKRRVGYSGHREVTLTIIHGFAKNETDNLTPKELKAFKAFAKILIGLTDDQIATALKNGDFKEVPS